MTTTETIRDLQDDLNRALLGANSAQLLGLQYTPVATG